MSDAPRIVRATWPGASPSNPWGTPGPARIAIVGGYPGSDESWLQRPMVGAAGIELRTQLRQAGINPNDCLITNVVDTQPKDNNFKSMCLRKEELPRDYPIHIGPACTEGGNYYLAPEHLYNGARLRDELATARPTVVVALGAEASWALLGTTAIGSVRGVVAPSITSVTYKVVPTYNPAAILRNWRLRSIAVVDLVKARVEAQREGIHYDNAEIWIEPTLDDLLEFEARFIRAGQIHSSDIETMRGEITCIGIAPDRERAIVVPFRCDPVRLRAKDGTLYSAMSRNYWPTHADEMQAWRWVKRQLERLDVEKLGQNRMYDIQYERKYGIGIRRFTRDTMLMHHSIYAEMPKGLGFLGSVYTNFPSWKQLGARHTTEEKRDA
jgi:uracil-DNA glycosylase